MGAFRWTLHDGNVKCGVVEETYGAKTIADAILLLNTDRADSDLRGKLGTAADWTEGSPTKQRPGHDAPSKADTFYSLLDLSLTLRRELVINNVCNRCERKITGTIDELVKLRVEWLDVGPIERTLCTGDCTRTENGLGNKQGAPSVGWDSRREDGTVEHMPHAGLTICGECIEEAVRRRGRPAVITDLRYRLDGDLIRVVIAEDVICLPLPAGRAGWSMSGFGGHIDAGWLLAEGALPAKTKARREALANIIVAALGEHNKRIGRT
ncbi:MAG: hypothetical protein EPN91_13120 [Salinibacterium sp.]|nr:MAG: hypothetical protein EPN91_13120 [Salinibacterium sp.]